MKKFLLTCAVGILAFAQSFGVESSFGYCKNEIADYMGSGMSSQYSAAAIMIPGNVLAGYGDATLSAVEIGYGKMTNTKVEVFLSYDLKGDPFYIQEVNLEPMKFNTVKLNTPYSLTDKNLYIGYIAKTTSNADRPFGLDDNKNTVPDGTLIAYSTRKTTLPDKWQELSGYGNLCIRGVFTTPGKVENFLWPTSCSVPGMTVKDQEFNVEVDVRNVGENAVNSVEFSVKIGDAEPSLISYEVPAIASGSTATITVSGLKASEFNEHTPVAISITGVNGAENAMASTVLEGEIAVLYEYYTRTVVIEEGTGTACPWCVRGYVGMEYMREHYTDGSYVGIAAHIYNDDDPMYCSKYEAARTIFTDPATGRVGFPAATVNRQEFFDPSKESCIAVYDKIHNTYTFQKVDFTARYTNPRYEELEVMCDVTSLNDLASHKLGLAVVTTEDEVGPYQQDNGYSGGTNGEMEGFEKKGPKVSLVFNDVARCIISWSGNTAVMPESLEAGVPAKAESLYISTEKIQDLKNASISVLLIDTSNGRIVNATRIPMPEATIENVDPASVGIVIAGENDAEYYTLDGLKVADDVLAPGLYVKRQNGKSTKIVVK